MSDEIDNHRAAAYRAYAAVGRLLYDAGQFESAHGQRLLDTLLWLAAPEDEQEPDHENLLPISRDCH